MEMGGYISFSGMLTFPKSNEIRAIAADMPLDRLLVETDSPYLAPVPFRGKRNEPAHTVHTAKVLAEVRGMTPAATSRTSLTLPRCSREIAARTAATTGSGSARPTPAARSATTTSCSAESAPGELRVPAGTENAAT